MNPVHPQDNEYWDSEETGFAYIVRKVGKDRASKILVSAGWLGSAWEIGTTHEIYHDQTGAQAGYFTVVGTIDFASGVLSGDVPDRKLAHSVFK
jgi:hypothetical protein